MSVIEVETKTQLTDREKVMAYVANRLHRVDQHVIAAMYGVNSGRVAEAILAIEHTIKNTIDIYDLFIAQKKAAAA